MSIIRRPQRPTQAAPGARVVAVTGAAGRVGQACLRALAETSDHVIAIDVQPGDGEADGHVEWRRADLRKGSKARKAMAGATHLIHLAGHIAPDPTRPTQILVDNVTIAANVLAAFADGRPQAAAIASSASAYGMVFSPVIVHPDYVPLDEDHPCRPQETYGLSKLMIEQLAAMWTHRAGFSTVALRFPWTAGDEPERARRFLDVIDADPTGEIGCRHLWSYVHVADVADAFVRALEVSDGQAHILNVASDEIPGSISPRDLMATCHPDSDVREGLDQGFMSTERARRTLGWRPTHSLLPPAVHIP